MTAKAGNRNNDCGNMKGRFPITFLKTETAFDTYYVVTKDLLQAKIYPGNCSSKRIISPVTHEGEISSFLDILIMFYLQINVKIFSSKLKVG